MFASLSSPTGTTRLESGIESLWAGRTYYPNVLTWRTWFKGREVVAPSIILLRNEFGMQGCNAQILRVTRHRPQTGIGAGRELRVRLADGAGGWFEIKLRVTDLSIFFSISRGGCHTSFQDLSITRFPAGSLLLDSSDGQPQITGVPQALFTPTGKVVAFWQHGTERHIVLFDTPAELAARRFAALPQLNALAITDGRVACLCPFLTLPFTRAQLPAPDYGQCVTEAARAGFALICAAGGVGDDYRVLRGEPGEFFVAARRYGAEWWVGGVTSAPHTLTLRFEDLWLRTPHELRAQNYQVVIVRDPTVHDPKGTAHVHESFDGQAPDVRVVLDMAKSGGFLLRFVPENA